MYPENANDDLPGNAIEVDDKEEEAPVERTRISVWFPFVPNKKGLKKSVQISFFVVAVLGFVL